MTGALNFRSKPSESGELKLMEVGNADIGMPGDKYRIRLRIAGKYRASTAPLNSNLKVPKSSRRCCVVLWTANCGLSGTVLWEKLPKEDYDEAIDAPEGAWYKRSGTAGC